MDQYMTVPYVEGGRTLDGWDCWGCVYVVGKEVYGRNYPSYDDTYEVPFDYDELCNLIVTQSRSRWTQKGVPTPGDVIVFNIKGRPVHVGLFIGQSMFIHALDGSNTTIEKYTSALWRKRVEGFYDYG